MAPEQEAALIAQRFAGIDPVQLAAECKQLREMMDHPELCVAMEDVLRELGVSEEALESDS